MKLHRLLVVCIILTAVLSLAFAHDGTKKASTEKKSCCMKEAQATKASLPAGHPKVDGKDAEHCTVTTAGNKECTDGDMANCDMSHATKASVKKASNKMDCCKEAAKGVKAQATSKAKSSTTTAPKGTN